MIPHYLKQILKYAFRDIFFPSEFARFGGHRHASTKPGKCKLLMNGLLYFVAYVIIVSLREARIRGGGARGTGRERSNCVKLEAATEDERGRRH